jgi:probable rRNA maturation factor
VEDVSGSDATPKAGCFTRWLRRAFEGELSGELSIRIVGEDEGRALNSRYRGRPYATNVLSFAGADLPADTDGEIPRHLGDLVLCAPVVEREALEQNKAADAHWAHLAIHGVLHLLGFDHEADAEARVMEQREAELLLRLGFDDPYEDER